VLTPIRSFGLGAIALEEIIIVIRAMKVVLLLMSCVFACVLFGDTFTEVGDAGSLPATAEVTTGIGALTAIDGTLDPTSGDIADMYKIFITGGGTFSATTVGGASFDTELYLFDSAGVGIYANDDFTGFLGPSTLPAGMALTPSASGLYYLAISQCCFEPSNGSGAIFNASFDHNAVVGATQSGGALPITDYSGASDQTSGGGAYTITLTGAQFAAPVSAVPEPGTLFLLLTGVAGIIGRQYKERRRS